MTIFTRNHSQEVGIGHNASWLQPLDATRRWRTLGTLLEFPTLAVRSSLDFTVFLILLTKNTELNATVLVDAQWRIGTTVSVLARVMSTPFTWKAIQAQACQDLIALPNGDTVSRHENSLSKLQIYEIHGAKDSYWLNGKEESTFSSVQLLFAEESELVLLSSAKQTTLSQMKDLLRACPCLCGFQGFSLDTPEDLLNFPCFGLVRCRLTMTEELRLLSSLSRKSDSGCRINPVNRTPIGCIGAATVLFCC